MEGADMRKKPYCVVRVGKIVYRAWSILEAQNWIDRHHRSCCTVHTVTYALSH